MEKAFSLLKHKLFTANCVQYRQNLDEQLVCPTCYEQVFKKKLWVVSRQSHTNFFSHYFGDQDFCEERTKGENSYENSRDHYAQLQRLEAFNTFFREKITTAFVKIIGKQASNRLSSALEYSERICTKEIESRELEKLEVILISNLDEPITSSINENLEDLEGALLAIYWHLKSPHGQSNLRFITCISLLLSFHKENEHLEDILEKKTLKSKSNLNSLLLGNAVLLLANSEYVDWQGSIKPILNFLNPELKTTQPKKNIAQVIKGDVNSKNVSSYFACTHCKTVCPTESYKYIQCQACHLWFYTDPEEKIRKPDKLHKLNAGLFTEIASHPELNKKNRWIYCHLCHKQYYSNELSTCPHGSLIEKSETKFEVRPIEIKQCLECEAKFNTRNGKCPYCSRGSIRPITRCASCGKGLIKSALLPSTAGSKWRKCNFCNFNFECNNF